jgi:arsenite transporter
VSTVVEARPRTSRPALGTFERYLTVWVALCIIAGIVLGRLLPGPFQALGRLTLAEVNIPVAVLIWLMIVPMLLKVDFSALHRVAEQWRGIAVTVGINWLVKPFSMALLGWLFIGWLFRPWLPAGQIDSYIAGLILLAAAPCTAMVFVWSNLTDGEPNFTLTQVALNDTIMAFAFAPLVGLLLGLSSITVPWETLFLSVVLYILVPVIAAQIWRRSLWARGGEAGLGSTLRRLQPISLLALLATLVLLFGFQGEQIVRQPLVIVLLAVPIIIQVYLNAGIAYWLNRALGVPHNVACPSALIGASNFFELAVAPSHFGRFITIHQPIGFGSAMVSACDKQTRKDRRWIMRCRKRCHQAESGPRNPRSAARSTSSRRTSPGSPRSLRGSRSRSYTRTRPRAR